MELRSPAQMTPADNQLVQSHTADIAQAAEFYGYSLDGSWKYEQAVCPVAPNHILLNFSHQEANGSDSSFSAALPRQGKRVEIFPVLRSGYAPYAPAWGEHSYTVFNSLITEERKGFKKLDQDTAFSVPWKQWALCYVSLVSSPPAGSMAPFELASEITVVLGEHQTAQVGFSARDAAWNFSDWSLKFSPKGLLIKVVREQHPIKFTPATAADSEPPAGVPTPNQAH